jgi:molecular chaperone DnaJ
MENPYHILSIKPNATIDEIKKAYRTLAMRYHPDRETGNAARFNAITLAYELLSDPKKKTAYDLSQSRRIIIDPEVEARSLWLSLFNSCGLTLDERHHTS